MALVMTPIYTQTVGASPTSTVNFNNIPQFYTDLMLQVSARGNQGSQIMDIGMIFNNDTSSIYSYTGQTGNNGAASSFRIDNSTRFLFALFGNGNTSPANTFGNSCFYMPNYTSSNFKSALAEITNGSSDAPGYWMRHLAYLFRGTAPITSIRIDATSNTFVQYSTFTLYGIIRAGA